jgi:hypothetical protein
MNIFQSLVGALKGPLGAVKTQELTTIGSALSGVLPALLANPTKAGLIAAGAPAAAQIIIAQPSIAVEVITDLVAAIEQLGAAPASISVQTPVAQQVQSPPIQVAKVG